MFTKGQKLSKSKLYSGNFLMTVFDDDDAVMRKKEEKNQIQINTGMLKDMFEIVFFHVL